MNGPNLDTLTTYFRLMKTNGAAQVYYAALDAGVLAALQKGPQTSQQIADKCELRVRPTILLLEALRALNVVQACDTEYELTEVTQMLLLSEYRELGNQYWQALPDFLKTGEPIKKMDDVGQSEEAYQAQAAVLGWMLSHAAEAAAAALSVKPPRQGLRILDVGAGSAVWSLSIAKRNAGSHVTAVDWPSILQVAQETAETYGLTDRLTTLAGNFHEIELSADAFDLAILANVTHLQTADENARLLGRIHRSLVADGRIVIIDAFPGSSEGDVPFALYQLGLALRTEKGQVFSSQALQTMLHSQGFAEATFTPLDVPPFMVGMLVASAIK